MRVVGNMFKAIGWIVVSLSWSLACGERLAEGLLPEAPQAPLSSPALSVEAVHALAPARLQLLTPHPAPGIMPAVTPPSCKEGASPPRHSAYLARKAARGKTAKVVGKVSADLDGDGSLDTVEFRKNGLDYFWAVGDEVEWIGSGGRADPTFELLDLDPSDDQKQVVIRRNVYSLRNGRLQFLYGSRREGQFAVGKGADKDHVVATVVRQGPDVFLHINVGEDSIRARIDAPLCSPNVRLAQHTLPKSVEGNALLVRVSDETGERVDILLSRNKSGTLTLHKPWKNTTSWESTKEGIVVSHWHCGILQKEVWRVQDGRLVSARTTQSGSKDERMCGAAKLGTADLNGDGVDESIALVTGAIRVGNSVVVIPKEVPGFANMWDKRMPAGAPISVDSWDDWKVVDIDVSDKRKELVLSFHAGEDYELSFFFHYDGANLKAGPVLGPGNPKILGNGIVRSGHGNCGQSVTQTWKLKHGHLRLVRQKKQGRFDNDHCAACPFVYRLDGDAWHKKGEILRHLIGATLDGWQSLEIGPIQQRKEVLALSIREEKPETTYLDAVYISVGEERFLPLACDGSNVPAYCSADGRVSRIESGDAIELEFALPKELSGRALMWAKGYYVAHPDSR